MSADARVKSFIDRILRLKEEQDALAADIRDVYAEAKGEGYNKTAMGEVVAYLRKVEKKGRTAVDEKQADFDLYLGAYERASGTALATHTHEKFPSQAIARAMSQPEPAGSMGDEIPARLPAQESGGAALGESHGGKSNAARPASVDAQPNGRGSVGQAEESVVTGGESAASDFQPPAFLAAREEKPLRPYCQRPEMCGGYGSKHCRSCERDHEVAA